MEGAPTTPAAESGSDKKGKDGNKKKNSARLGGVAVERPKIFDPEAAKPAAKPGALERLGFGKKPAEKTTEQAESSSSESSKEDSKTGLPSDEQSSAAEKQKKVELVPESPAEAKETEAIAALQPEEKQQIIARYVAAAEQLKHQHQEDASQAPDTLEDTALQQFYDKLKTKDIETAAAETISELPAIESADEREGDKPDDDQSEAELIINHEPEPDAANYNEQTVAPNKPTPAAGSGGRDGSPPRAPGGVGGAAMPPGPPYRSSGNVYGGMPFGNSYSGIPLNVNTANAVRSPSREYFRVRAASPSGDFLFGLFVGDLIGRRRGRIKTERKLLPVQKSLERNVHKLQQEIIEKEALITAAVRKRRFETPLQATRTEKIKESITRSIAMEANQLHGKKAPEQIGKLLVNSERLAIAETLTAPSSSAEADSQLPINRQVETISRKELLELANKIYVEDSSLRQIYETHLVDEKGLRRLVAEHLRGGDVLKRLRKEIVERDIAFERDPALRKQMTAVADPKTGLSPTGSEALEAMLTQATRQLPGDDENVRRRNDSRTAKHAAKTAPRPAGAADITMATTIVLLLAIIIYLLIIRG